MCKITTAVLIATKHSAAEIKDKKKNTDRRVTASRRNSALTKKGKLQKGKFEVANCGDFLSLFRVCFIQLSRHT